MYIYILTKIHKTAHTHNHFRPTIIMNNYHNLLKRFRNTSDLIHQIWNEDDQLKVWCLYDVGKVKGAGEVGNDINGRVLVDESWSGAESLRAQKQS